MYGRRSDYFRPLPKCSRKHIVLARWADVPADARELTDRVFVDALSPSEHFETVVVMPHFFDNCSTPERLCEQLDTAYNYLLPGGKLVLFKPILSDYSPKSTNLLLQRLPASDGQFSLTHFSSASGRDYAQYDVPLKNFRIATTTLPHHPEFSIVLPGMYGGTGVFHSVQVLHILKGSVRPNDFLELSTAYSEIEVISVTDFSDGSFGKSLLTAYDTWAKNDTISMLEFSDLPRLRGKSAMWTPAVDGHPVFGFAHNYEAGFVTQDGECFTLRGGCKRREPFSFKAILHPTGSNKPYDPVDPYRNYQLYVLDIYEKGMSFSERQHKLHHIVQPNWRLKPCFWDFVDSNLASERVPLSFGKNVVNGMFITNGADTNCKSRHIYRVATKKSKLFFDKDLQYNVEEYEEFYPYTKHIRADYPREELTAAEYELFSMPKPTLTDVAITSAARRIPVMVFDLSNFDKGIPDANIFNQDSALGQLLVSTYPNPLVWTGADDAQLTRALLIRQSRYITVPGSNDHLVRMVNSFVTLAKTNGFKRKGPLYVPKEEPA